MRREHPDQRPFDGVHHEDDEGVGIPRAVASGDGRAIRILEFVDAALQRHILENGIPLRQQGCLPEAGHAPVPVFEGMDEHEFVVEHAGENQGMHAPLRLPHPGEERSHVLRDQPWRRRHENAAAAVGYAFVVGAEHAGFLDGQVGHDAVETFQFVQRIGVEPPQQVVGRPGVLTSWISLAEPRTSRPSITSRTSSMVRELASMAKEEWMERIRLFRLRRDADLPPSYGQDWGFVL